MRRIALIVEGINDEKQIRNAFDGLGDIDVVVTEGTKVDTYIIDEIYSLMDSGHTPYILSDPDMGGSHLAKMVQSHFPNIERINVDIEECGYHTGAKMKAGVEYASYEYLRSIIYPLMGLEYKKKEYPICWD